MKKKVNKPNQWVQLAYTVQKNPFMAMNNNAINNWLATNEPVISKLQLEREKEIEEEVKKRDNADNTKPSTSSTPELPKMPTLDSVVTKRDTVASKKDTTNANTKEKPKTNIDEILNVVKLAGENLRHTYDLLRQKRNEVKNAGDAQLIADFEKASDPTVRAYLETISGIDKQINELDGLFKQLMQQRTLYSSIADNVDAVTHGASINQSVLELGEKILKLLKDKENKQLELMTYKESLSGMVDPREIRRNTLLETSRNSDAWKLLQYQKDNLEKKFTQLTQTNLFSPIANKINQGERNSILQQYSDCIDKENNYLQLEKEVGEWMYHNRDISLMPKRLQQKAEQLFNVNHKNMMHDKEWLDEYYKSQIALLSDFDAYNSSAKIRAANVNKSSLSDEQIDQAKLENEMLAEAAASQIGQNAYALNSPFLFVADKGLDNLHEFNEKLKSNGVKFGTLDNTEKFLARTKEALNYIAANEFLERAKERKAIHENIKYKFDNYIDGVSHATVAAQAFWDFGKGEVLSLFRTSDHEVSKRLKDASDAFRSGSTLTRSQKALLEAANLKNIYDGVYDLPDTSNAYKWAEITAESLEFMAEFIATSGVLSGIHKGLKVGQFATQAISEILAEGGASAMKKLAWQAGKRLVGDAAYSAMQTATLGLGRTLDEYYRLGAGTIKGNYDPYGELQIESIDAETDAPFRTAFIRNWIENFSEMMGEWGVRKNLLRFGIDKAKPYSKMIREIEYNLKKNKLQDLKRLVTLFLHDSAENLDKIVNPVRASKAFSGLINTVKFAPLAAKFARKDLAKKAQWSGFFGEVLEEYYGITLNHMLGTEDSKYSGKGGFIKNIIDESADIWGGIGFSTGLLGIFGGMHHSYYKAKYKNAEAQLVREFGVDLATKIKNDLIFHDTSELAKKFTRLATGVSSNLHQDQVLALFDYFGSLTQLRGSVLGEDFIQFGMKRRKNAFKRKAEELGYAVDDYANLVLSQEAKEVLKQDLLEKSGSLRGYIEQSLESGRAVSEIVNELYESDPSQLQNEELMNLLSSYDIAERFERAADRKMLDLQSAAVRNNNIEIMQMGHRDGNIYQTVVPTDDSNPLSGHTLYIVSGDVSAIPTLSTNKQALVNQEIPMPTDSGRSNDGQYLVYDATTHRYLYLSKDDLSGMPVKNMGSVEWHMSAGDHAIRQSYVDYQNEQISKMDNVGKVGEKRQLDDGRTVTVLKSTTDGRGLVFALTPQGKEVNADNSEIVYDEDGSQYKSLMDGDRSSKISHILDFFKNFGARSAKDDINDILLSDSTPIQQAVTILTEEPVMNEEEPAVINRSEYIDDTGDKATIELVENGPTTITWDLAELTAAQEEDEVVMPEPAVLENPVDFIPQPITIEPEPEVIPEVTSDVPQVDITLDLQTTINNIENLARQNHEMLVGITGAHYILNISGKRTLVPRVHQFLGPQWGQKRYNVKTVGNKLKDGSDAKTIKQVAAEYNLAISQLISRYGNDVTAFKTALESMINDVVDQMQTGASEDVTKAYKARLLNRLLLDQYLYFIENKITDQYSELSNGISEILANPEPGVSVDVGNVYDTIGRMALNYKKNIDEIKYDNPNLTINIKGVPFHISTTKREILKELVNKGYIVVQKESHDKNIDEPLVSKELFNIILNNFKDIKEYYAKRNITLITDVDGTTEVLLFGKYKNGSTINYVAGTTDVIGVDEHGIPLIIDLKTFNAESKDYTTAILDSESLYYKKFDNPANQPSSTDVPSSVNKNRTSKEAKTAILQIINDTRSTAEQYGLQVNSYRLLLQTALNISKVRLPMSLMLFGVKYRPTGILFDFYTEKNKLTGAKKLKEQTMTYSDSATNEITPYLVRPDFYANGEIKENVAKFFENYEFVNSETERNDELEKLRIEYSSIINNLKGFTNSMTTPIQETIDVATEAINTLENLYTEAGNNIVDLQNCINEAKHQLLIVLAFHAMRINTLEQERLAVAGELLMIAKDLVNRDLTAGDAIGLVKGHTVELQHINRQIVDVAYDDDITTKERYDKLQKLIDSVSKIIVEEHVTYALLDNYPKKARTVHDLADLAHAEFEQTKQHLIENIPVRSKSKHEVLELILLEAEKKIQIEVSNYLAKDLRLRTMYDHTQLVFSSKKLGNRTVLESTSPSGKKLVDAINSDPQFTNAAEFYIQKSTDSETSKSFKYDVVIKYQGEEYSPIALSLDLSKIGELDSAIETKLAKDGERIQINNRLVGRTIGVIDNLDKPVSVTLNLFTVKDGQLFTKNTGKPVNSFGQVIGESILGVSKISRESGSPKAVITTISDNPSVIYRYSGRNVSSNTSPGIIQYLHKSTYTSNGKLITETTPINLYNALMTSSDVEFITKILRGDFSENIENLPNYGSVSRAAEILNSKFKDCPYITCRDVLSLYLPQMSSLMQDMTTQIYMGRTVNGNMVLHTNSGSHTINFTSEEEFNSSIENLANAISDLKLRVSISLDILNSNTHTNTMFARIGQYLNDNSKQALKIGRFDFKREYYNSLPTSGLCWYVDNNILTTQFAGITNPLINFSIKPEDVLSFNAAETQDEHIIDVEDDEIIERRVDIDLLDNLEKVNQEQWKQDVLNELGSVIPVKFYPIAEAQLESGVLLGSLKPDIMELADFNLPGTQFHEIFHDVVELLLPDEERNLLYSEMQKVRNKKKQRDARKRKTVFVKEHRTEKQLAEDLAEGYRMFRLEGIKPIWAKGESIWNNIVNLFDNITANVKMCKKIGSYTLYRYYMNTQKGKYKDKHYTPETLKRFNRIFKKGAPMIIRRLDIPDDSPYFRTDKEIEDCVNTIKHILVQKDTQYIETTGERTGFFKRDIETLLKAPKLKTILESVVYEKSGQERLILILGIATDENGDPVYDEKTKSYVLIEGNKNYETLKNRIAKASDMMTRENVSARLKYESEDEDPEFNPEKPEDTPAPDPDTDENLVGRAGREATDGHREDAVEISPIKKLSKQVKAFVSDIQHCYRIYSQNNNGETARPLRPYKNSIGLPEDWDLATVWNLLLSELSGCRSELEMLDRLKTRQDLDETGILSQVYKKLKKQFDLAYNFYDDGTYSIKNTDEAHDAHGLIGSFYQYASLPKVDKKSAHNNTRSEDLETAGSTTIVDLDYNTAPRRYRYSWSRKLAYGATPYLHRTADKNNPYSLEDVEHFRRMSNELNEIQKWLKDGKNSVAEGFEIPVEITLVKEVKDRKGKKRKQSVSNILNLQLNQLDHDNILHYEAVKQKICDILFKVGIDFDTKELDFALKQYFEQDVTKTGPNGLYDMLNNSGIDRFIETLRKIEEFVTDGNYKLLETLWANPKGNKKQFLSFVDMLSKRKYEHHKRFEERSATTPGGKKQYLFSEENRVSLMVSILDKLQDPSLNGVELEQTLMNPYRIMKKDGVYIGGRIWKAVRNARENPGLAPLVCFNPYTVPGFTTDTPNSKGEKYAEMSTLENVITRYAALANGDIVHPPFADKVSWGGLEFKDENGIEIDPFGFDYYGIRQKAKRTRRDKETADQAYTRELSDYVQGMSGAYESHWNENLGIYEIDFPLQVVQQMLEYYECEYQSAKILNQRHKQKAQNPSSTYVEFAETGNPKDKVKDKDGNLVTAVQSARLVNLSGIYDENGKFISFNRLLDEEDNHFDETANLEIAEAEFFSKSPEEKRTIVKRLLSYSVNRELLFLMENGLIKKDENGKYINISLNTANLGSFAQYLYVLKKNNKGESAKSNDVTSYKIYRLFQENQSKNIKDESVDLRNSTILAYVADMTVKYEMSMNESSRYLVGSPNDYKWSYNSDGQLVDATTDMFKRFGGMSSTGMKSSTSLREVGPTYKMTSIRTKRLKSADYEKFVEQAFPQDVKSSLIDEKKKRDADCRYITIADLKDSNKASVKAFRKIQEEVENMSHEERCKELEKLNQARYKQLLDIIDSRANSLKSLEATDGATFVSPQMCKKLLMSRGRWNAETRHAFEVLTDPNVSTADMLTLEKYWHRIQNELIGTQKYTAVGQRFEQFEIEEVNEETGERRMVPYGKHVTYFLKTAFFPVFKCMCTGFMGNVLQRMENEGIDLLAMTTSLKEGNAGFTLNFDEEGNPLGTYSTDEVDVYDEEKFFSQKWTVVEYPFSDLRHQFNTEPNEKILMSMGTQMGKVVQSTLGVDKQFDFNGEKVESYQIRDMMMEAINKTTELGLAEFLQKFCKRSETSESGWEIDESKYNQALYDMFKTTDASDSLKEALNPADGRTLPLDAMSGNNWMESIVTSRVNSSVIDIITPGAAYYQRPLWAMDNLEEFSKEHIHLQTRALNNGKTLHSINEAGSMDIALSIDFFNYLFKGHQNLERASFAEKRAWLIKNGIISGYVEAENDAEATHCIVQYEGTYKGKKFVGKKGKKGKLEKYEINYTKQNPLIGEVHNISEYDDLVKNSKSKFLTETIDGEEVPVNLKVIKVKWLDAKTNIVGYRIPTQAISSIHAMRCVDVLPMPEHTVILPHDIVGITGSDFDIDKFFLSTMYYQEGEDGLLHNDAYNKDSKQYWINRLLELQISVLTATGNDMASLKGSIDTDTRPLEKIGKAIRSALILRRNRLYNETIELKPGQINAFSLAVRTTMDFMSGKEAIGPYALNNNNHVLCVLYGVSFVDQTSILSELNIVDENNNVVYDMKSIHDSVDRNGRAISSELSGSINVNVDVAKDPFVAYLNLNKFTYNLSNLLWRTGFGVESLYFLTQPIMWRFAKAYNIAKGLYKQDETISQSIRATNEVNSEFFKFVNEYATNNERLKNPDKEVKPITTHYYSKQTDDASDDLTSFIAKRLGASLSMVNALRVSLMTTQAGIDIMEECSTYINDISNKKWNLPIKDKNGAYSLSFDVDFETVQALVAIEQFKLNNMAEKLSRLVQFTKIDTKKHGKTLIEQFSYEQGFNELLNSKDFTNLTGENGMLTSSFIEHKTKAAIQTERLVMGHGKFIGTELYLQQIKDVAKYLGSLRTDATFYTQIHKALLNKIKSRYFFGDVFRSDLANDSYCKKTGINPRNLMRGDRSILKRLLTLQTQINDVTDNTYAAFRDPVTHKCNNLLLNSLQAGHITSDDMAQYDFFKKDMKYDQWKECEFISIDTKTDNIKDSDILKAWDDLLNADDYADLQQFASDLVVYSFMTSADNGGGRDIFKFVPPSWRKGTCSYLRDRGINEDGSYGEFIRRWVAAYNNPSDNRFGINPHLTNDEIEDIVLHYIHDDVLISATKQSVIDRCMQYATTLDKGKDITKAEIFAGIDANDRLVFGNRDILPNIIKVPTIVNVPWKEDGVPLPYGQLKYRVYKLVGYGSKTVLDTEDPDNEKKQHTLEFPVYALTLAYGGIYGGGNILYTLGIFDTPTAIEDRQKEYVELKFAKQILDLKTNTGNDNISFFSVSDFMQQLLTISGSAYMVSAVNIDKRSKPLIEDNRWTLSQFFNPNQTNDAITLVEPKPKLRSDFSIAKLNAYNKLTLQENSALNFDQIDKAVYSTVSTADDGNIAEAFNTDGLNELRNKGWHIELYKKRYQSSLGEKYMYTVAMSISGEAAKGAIEVSAKIDETQTTDKHFVPSKFYSINLNTILNSKQTSDFATVPMSSFDVKALLNRIVSIIPSQGYVTIDIPSDQNINVINHLSEYNNRFVKTQDSETLSTDDNTITTPIWLLDGVDKSTVPSEKNKKSTIPTKNITKLTFIADIREKIRKLTDISTLVNDILHYRITDLDKTDTGLGMAATITNPKFFDTETIDYITSNLTEISAAIMNVASAELPDTNC